MKENTTDATTGLMSILGGKGGIKMGPGFKMSNIITALKPGNILKTLKGGLKGLKNKGRNLATTISTGFSKLLAGGIKGIKSFGAKLKKMFSKKKNKDLTPDEINKKTVAEHKTPDGHTKKVLDDGQVATCSACSTTRNTYKKELDNPDNVNLKDELDILENKLSKDPLNEDLLRQQQKIEKQLELSKTASTKANPQKIDFDNLHELKVCFPAGTMIHTLSGTKAIEQICLGDKVYSYNTSTKSVEVKEVIELLQTETTMLVNIKTASEIIKTTAKHPFWDEGQQIWTPAALLKKDGQLRLINNECSRVVEIFTEKCSIKTYNFGVSDNHNYFVGSSGVLVHNKISPTSAYLNTDVVKMEFYEIYNLETLEIEYVGQTQSNVGIDNRFDQHIEEGKSGGWKQKLNKKKYGIRNIGPSGKEMTTFQANLTEQKLISERGGKTLLQNKNNAMSKSKFNDMKKLLANNPELYRQLFNEKIC